jgi:hypothetical protein
VVVEVAMRKAVDVRADRVALDTENDMEAPVSFFTSRNTLFIYYAYQTDTVTDETGKMTDETEVKETGEMKGTEGTPRIAGERTTVGTMTLTGRTRETLPEKKILEILQDNCEKTKVHTTVQLQLLSFLHRCQNKGIKLVCEIVINALFTDIGIFKTVLEECPPNHNHNPRPDQSLIQMCQTKVMRRVRRWTLSMMTTQP